VKKGIIFYFSGTGNTWWLTKKLKENLTSHSIETKLVNIEKKQHSEYQSRITEYDVVGFGYPIYGSDCPQIYWKFIKTLPKLNSNKNVFIYTSMLAFSGDGSLVAERHLRKKGYMIKQAVNTHMPNNLKLPYPVIDQFPIYDEEQKARILGYAEVKIRKLAEKIVNNEEWVEGRGLLGILRGSIPESSSCFFWVVKVGEKLFRRL
jgi:flavodoxin